MSLFYICLTFSILTFVKADGVVSMVFIESINSPEKLENEKTGVVLCANSETECQNSKTCCSTPNGEHYCCPYNNAVCCSNRIQCCPEGTSCDLTSNKCIAIPLSAPLYSHELNPDEIHYSDSVQKHYFNFLIKIGLGKFCPDNKHKCPGKKHCCAMDSGNFGCCKFNQGICCPDLKTCCPHNTICDVPNGKCISNSAPLTPNTFKSQSSKSQLKTIVCPDNFSECPSWQTCCQVEDNRYGCCEFENATCCADKVSCCPHNYKCNLVTKTCTKPNKSTVAFSEIARKRKSLISFYNNDGLEKNCSKLDRCLSSDTCCAVGQGRYGCCPYKNGVCCLDSKTCCPQGKTCTINDCK